MPAMKFVLVSIYLCGSAAIKLQINRTEDTRTSAHANTSSDLHVGGDGYPSYHGSRTRLKCFLSKSSTFTDPDLLRHRPTTEAEEVPGHGYWDSWEMDFAGVEEQITLPGSLCDRCLVLFSTDPSAREHIKAMPEEEQDDAVKEYLESLDVHCKACFKLYTKTIHKTWGQQVSTRIFKSQQETMNELAKALLDPLIDISLYLDFQDMKAEAKVSRFRGREWPAELLLELGQTLRERVGDADVFLHWEASGGEACWSERAAALFNGKYHPRHNLFSFPPLSTLPYSHVAGCRNRNICQKFGSRFFAVKVCQMCGGVHGACARICEDCE